MIKDKLKNSHLYYGLHEKFRTALQFLEKGRFVEVQDEVMDVEGSNIYALYKKYETVPCEEEAEAHRKYIDIHFCIKGSEIIYYSSIDYVKQITEYEEETDCEYFRGAGEMLILHAGEFAVFYPEDVHMPKNRAGEDAYIEKVLVKVIV